MEIVLPEESSHWYTSQGEPCHMVPTKDGKSMRNVSLRWDRHLGLLPSVTNIIGIKVNPAITVYKLNQAITSCLTLPRIEGETEDDFAKRVVVDMDVHRHTAAEFGSQVHLATERLHRHLKKDGFGAICPSENDKVEPYIADYRRWLKGYAEEVLDAEFVVVNDILGYAGTVDLIFRRRSDKRLVFLDTKTQGEKTDKKGKAKPLKTYDTWLLQLRAYAYEHKMPILISAIINSSRPAPVVIHEWPQKDYKGAWRAFCACYYLWSWSNNYFPTKYWER